MKKFLKKENPPQNVKDSKENKVYLSEKDNNSKVFWFWFVIGQIVATIIIALKK